MNFNFVFASSKGGSTLLRYDDTNPSAEEQRYIDSIAENCRWLGHKPSKVRNPKPSLENPNLKTLNPHLQTLNAHPLL